MTSSFTRLAAVALLCSAVAVSVSSAQTVATVVNFNGPNGINPQSALVEGSDGNYCGTTFNGGFSNYGTIFRITPGGTLTLLHSFSNHPDGARPWSALIQATDGNFYGTTSLGGTLGGGSVFVMNSSGAVTILHSFGGSGPTIPYGGLVQGTDGNLYGTTSAGGSTNHGTVYKITPSGTLTVLYSFAGTDGAAPYGTLIEGSDGNFYGTTWQGGAANMGTVFSVTPDGTLTTLYSFSGADGNQPYAGLVQGSDGNFYGTTFLGGANGNGTVFQITSAGTLTTLHSFCAPSNCDDGSHPYASLIQGADGSFYGTASLGGRPGLGTAFKVTSGGVFTTVHAFSSLEGRYPRAPLVPGASGTFYGTTYSGGGSNSGTVFVLSPTPFQLVTVPPCRLLDTRNSSPITGGTAQSFDLRQLAQDNGCADLSAASVYSLNVTLVPINNSPVSYLTIWPAGQPRPTISTMNSLDGRTKANAAIVSGGTGGQVSVFVTQTANVLLDISAYFTPATPSTLAFYPLAPCRVADTRGGQGPYLHGGQERDFAVRQSSCGIPPNAQAYSLNFTVLPHNSPKLDYLTVWPAGQSQPAVSTLNNPTGTYVANAAIVAAGTGGNVAVYPSQDTDLLIDINGYFGTNAVGALSLYPAVPCRVLDTRHVGSGQPFNGTLNPPVDVPNSGCAVPTAAHAYVFNTTVVPSGFLGYLTLWPDSEGQPTVSTLNAIDGAITSNMSVVPVVDGKIDAYASGLTQLILDITNYFAQ